MSGNWYSSITESTAAICSIGVIGRHTVTCRYDKPLLKRVSYMQTCCNVMGCLNKGSDAPILVELQLQG
jgi:hypothetical protein